jgi:hypothetical protein
LHLDQLQERSRMSDDRPSSRRLGRVAAIVVVIALAIIAVMFVGQVTSSAHVTPDEAAAEATRR